jgi:hypothetical protein
LPLKDKQGQFESVLRCPKCKVCKKEKAIAQSIGIMNVENVGGNTNRESSCFKKQSKAALCPWAFSP